MLLRKASICSRVVRHLILVLAGASCGEQDLGRRPRFDNALRGHGFIRRGGRARARRANPRSCHAALITVQRFIWPLVWKVTHSCEERATLRSSALLVRRRRADVDLSCVERRPVNSLGCGPAPTGTIR